MCKTLNMCVCVNGLSVNNGRKEVEEKSWNKIKRVWEGKEWKENEIKRKECREEKNGTR